MNGLGCILICKTSYPSKSALRLTSKFLNDLKNVLTADQLALLEKDGLSVPDANINLFKYLQDYNEPERADMLDNILETIDETKVQVVILMT